MRPASRDDRDWDVIIIGTGAGGGTLAARLARTGKRILLLERGALLPREPENWSEQEVAVRGRYRARERWLDAHGEPLEPYTHHWVGGNTKLYGGALFRLREHDFSETRHYGGVSPAWPLGYADFEPYYRDAELMYQVRGRAGADPCEPPRSSGYALPPLPHEPRIAELAGALAAVGLRPFPLPLALALPEDRDPHAAPLRLGPFDGYPDPTESKADAHVIGVRAALAAPNVALRTESYVERLSATGAGRAVDGVVVRGASGERELLRASLVVVACGAIESAALLLRSPSDRHPHGLANKSGLVGRNFMRHNNGALIAYSRRENRARFQKTFALTDFYRGGPGGELPLGAIQLMGKSDRATLRELFQERLPDVPVDELVTRTIDFWLTAEDLPSPDNRVALTADGRIQLRYRRNNVEAYRLLRAALERALTAAEPASQFVFAGYELGDAGVSHQCGTLRFGHDPKTSVLDPFCRAHELDNLYAVDGSFFCSSGAVNPSLTIMANALRVGDHLAARIA